VQAILELQGLAPGEIEPRLAELLKDLNISHLRKHARISLSGGERRRLEIARALATKPAFILLDEPFAGVDRSPCSTFSAYQVLKERGIGVLITDHNVRETWASATAPTSASRSISWLSSTVDSAAATLLQLRS